MSKLSTGNDIYWLKDEVVYCGRIFMIYTTYLVTTDEDRIEIKDCYHNLEDAIKASRKFLKKTINIDK